MLPALYVRHAWVGAIYDPSVGPGYAFILNLVCTSFITFFFIPELTGFKYRFDTRLMKRMLGYSWPILILGIAGILNQTADKSSSRWCTATRKRPSPNWASTVLA